MALTAAALIEGLMRFHEPSQIKGVIFNRVKSPGHYELLKKAVEKHLAIACYGYLKPSTAIQLKSRHLGLIQAQEDLDVEDKIEKMAALVEETVDLTKLLFDFNNSVDQSKKVAYDGSGSVSLQESLSKIKNDWALKVDLRIGYARDDAFSFYYDENLETLREIGIKLIPFSPIADGKLPDTIDGIYLGGGYPEVFAKALMDNVTMRESIRAQAQAGMPMYAECGGLMYLMKTIETRKGEVYEMTGVFDGCSNMTDRLQHFGHVEAILKLQVGGKWESINYRGHEFHHSVVTARDLNQVIEVNKKEESWHCGYHKHNVLGTYVHNHFYSNLAFLEWLLYFLTQNKRRAV